MSKLSLGLIAALVAAPVFAQSATSAGVGGQVLGADGRPVAGAEVTILHIESGTVSRAVTDASGRYNARGLRVGGPYSITVTKAGEGTSTEDNIFLNLNQVSQINTSLRGDDVATLETVTAVAVAGSMDIFSANKMGAGTNVPREQIDALPSIQRSVQDYVRLDPRIAQTDKGRGEISAGGQNTRFNAIRIDGINTSDTFGLEANNFPVRRQPVSMDAIQEIRVDLSNYDTTITGATGAVVDAVTKSGTNSFSGSVYGTYRENDWVRKNTDGSRFSGFTDEYVYGGTFGGPLVKDRLFFFANYEKSVLTSPAPAFGPVGSGASNIVNITPDQIAEAQQIAQSVWGIDIGTLETPDGVEQEVEEYAIKLDWNINDDHRASLRYSKLEQADPILAGSGNQSLSLNSRWYTIDKNFESVVGQLFSDWTQNFSTELKLGQREYDSLSTVFAPLPQMSIGFGTNASDPDQPANPVLNFGADEFRHGNQIETKTLTGLAAGTLFAGDHTLKFGVDYESNDIFNLFAQNIWGAYDFASLDHFREGRYWQYRLNAPVPGFGFDTIPMNYTHRNTGIFVQDTWAFNYNLSVMFGLRVDVPDLDDVPVHNQLVQQIYGYDNRATLDTELWQPRLGFNYTFDGDLQSQLRGGVGLFQGAAANVWVGNSYQNHGFGLIGYNSVLNANMTQEEREAIWTNLPFNPDIDNPTTPPPAAGYQMMVNLMDDDMKQPSVWKANLAFDHELPWWGVVASAEALFTQVQDGLHFERLDLGTRTAVGPDGRPLFWGNLNNFSIFRANGNREINALRDAGQMPPGYENVTGWHNDGVILMKNTDKGMSRQFTVSLNKPLLENWAWMFGYTYTRATEVSPITSSRAISNWNGRMIFDPNEDVASRSNYEIRDRFIGSLTFSRAFFGSNKTEFSMFYEGRSGRPYSWIFGNDANGDGYINDLLYVPNGPNDVLFGSRVDGQFVANPEMQQAFFDWLGQNTDLSRFAGTTVPRNSARSSWVNTFDLRIKQELPGFFDGHKSEIWLDVMNIGNLINKDWGRIEEIGFPFGRRVVNVVGMEDGKYIYNFNANNVFQEQLYDNVGQSRWALQVGVRYRF